MRKIFDFFKDLAALISGYREHLKLIREIKAEVSQIRVLVDNHVAIAARLQRSLIKIESQTTSGFHKIG